MTKRNQSILASALALAVVLAGVILPKDKSPGTQSSGSPTDADYCNVLLVPSLAEALGLDLALRVQMAQRGARLLRGFRNPSGLHSPLTSAGEVVDKIGTKMVERYGREAKGMLPPYSRRAFERLFSSGKLVRVGFWTEKGKSGSLARDRFFVTSGWFAEEKNRVGQKSADRNERALRDCYQWIPSAEEAERLLEHEDKDVWKAAEAWLEENTEPPEHTLTPVPSPSRQRRAKEREDFRARVRAQQESVRRKIEAARRGER